MDELDKAFAAAGAVGSGDELAIAQAFRAAELETMGPLPTGDEVLRMAQTQSLDRPAQMQQLLDQGLDAGDLQSIYTAIDNDPTNFLSGGFREKEQNVVASIIDLSKLKGISIGDAIEAQRQELVAGPPQTMLDSAKQWIRERTGLFEPPIYSGRPERMEKPLRTLAGAAGYYGSEYLNGLGLSIPDILAHKTTGAQSLADLVGKVTGFEPTPREIQGGEVTQFLSGLRSIGSVSKLAINRIAARTALRRTLKAGVDFAGVELSDEVAQKIINNDPIDLKTVWAAGGMGVLFGIAEVALAAGVERWTAGQMADEYAKRIPGLDRIPRADRIRHAQAAIDSHKVTAGEMTMDEWSAKWSDHLQDFSDKLRDLSIREVAGSIAGEVGKAGEKAAAPAKALAGGAKQLTTQGPVSVTDSGLKYIGELRQRIWEGEPLAPGEEDFLKEVGVDPKAEAQAAIELKAAQLVEQEAQRATEKPQKAEAPGGVVEAGSVAETAPVAAGPETVAEGTKQPWEGATVEDESRWYGTNVIVDPELKGETEFTGTVTRVLNGGKVIEVKPDGYDSVFRYESARVHVTNLVDRGAKIAPQPSEAKAQKPPEDLYKNPYKLAAKLKSQGVSQQEAYSRYVQAWGLRSDPLDLDAKEFYAIYAKADIADYPDLQGVTQAPAIPETGGTPGGTTAKEPWEMTQADFVVEAKPQRNAPTGYKAIGELHGPDFRGALKKPS